MDFQLVLIIILSVLTVSLVAVSFYVILVLHDFRETLKKTNTVIDDVHAVTSIVSHPMVSIVSIVGGLMNGFKAAKSITSLKDSSSRKEGR